MRNLVVSSDDLRAAVASAGGIEAVVRGTRDQRSALDDTSPDEFFANWEKQFLLGRLLDKEELSADLTALHDRFERRYGVTFSSPG